MVFSNKAHQPPTGQEFEPKNLTHQI